MSSAGTIRSGSIPNLDFLDSNASVVSTKNNYGDYSKSKIEHGSRTSIMNTKNPKEQSDRNNFKISDCCSTISTYLPILHPFGPFRCVWDLMVMLMLVYTCVEVPITLAFDVELDFTFYDLYSWFKFISFMIDILLCIDILLQFRTAYFDKWSKLTLIIDEWEIAKRYLKGWFFIDLLTSLPFEFMIPQSNVVKVVKVLRIFRFIRIIKILRLFKMIKTFDGFMKQFVSHELVTALKFCKIFSLMLLCAHISACFWFYVGYSTMESETGSWVSIQISDDRQILNDMDTFDKYSYAWYWAVVTLFTTGYGDIVATNGNKAEQWVVSICILVGTCFFAYFIGTLTSLITEGDRIKGVKYQKLEEAQAFCDHKKLPRELSRAIYTHLRYHCGYNYLFDEAELISSLPPYLQNDIHYFLAQSVLMQLDFFDPLSKAQRIQILGQIALKMRSISCNENYCLYQKGDRAKEFYIQRTGKSVVDYHDGSKEELERGAVIGERSIFSPKRRTTVICSSFCEFYVVSIQDIVQILQTEYPNSWSKRWVKLSKGLKHSFKENAKKIRFVDFSKKKTKIHHYHIDSLEVPNGSTERVSSSWSSTIRSVGKKDKNGIKKVNLMLNGNIEMNAINALEIIKESEKTKAEIQHSAHSKSEGMILTNKNSSNGGRMRSVSDQNQPKFDHSQSMRTNSIMPKVEHKKSKTSMFSSFFVKRNSLDRDNAIQRSVRKRTGGNNMAMNDMNNNSPRNASFYDHNEFVSSSRDSSDDSNDIVPHQHEDWDDDNVNDDTVISPTSNNLTEHMLHNNLIAILGAENKKQRKVKFGTNDIIKQHNRKQSNSMGRKGGSKFGGGKKRNVASGKGKGRKVNLATKHMKLNSYPNTKKQSQSPKAENMDDNLQVIGDMVAVQSSSVHFDDDSSSNEPSIKSHEKTETTKIIYSDDDYMQSPVNEEEMVQIDATPIIDANDQFVSIQNTEKVDDDDQEISPMDTTDDPMFMDLNSTRL